MKISGAIAVAHLARADPTTCSCASTTPCKYDPTCAGGGLGCDAQGQSLCRFCGFGAYISIPCGAPTPSPPIPPTPARPTPPPTPSAPPTPASNSSCFRAFDGIAPGVALSAQKALAAEHWEYQWGGAPYGRSADIAGVLQIVNGGSEPMWIRYSGNGIAPEDKYDWKPFIVNASALNGGHAHVWNALNSHGMGGQGDGFRLAPGEYQIVPFSSSACWFGGSCQIMPVRFVPVRFLQFQFGSWPPCYCKTIPPHFLC